MLTSQSRTKNSVTNPVAKGFADAFKPKKRLTLAEWAESSIVLASERSASPGPYRIGDAAYQREMMNAVTNPDNSLIAFCTSSQVGKTTILTATQGYFAEVEPSPQLSVWPNQRVADEYIEEDFTPLLRESTALGRIFKGHTYPGGYIAFVGANNPSQLARRPIRVVTGDEIDRWPRSADQEGSPRSLIKRRTQTFRNRKEVYASTPLRADTSEIVGLFKQVKQHYFYVVCDECKHAQVLRWENDKGDRNVIFDKNKEAEARYCCEECGCLWTELHKRRLVRDAEKNGGGWRSPKVAPFSEFKQNDKPALGHVGYWINALYSPWMTLAEIAKAWSEADGNPHDEQTFWNTVLGLPWAGDVSSVADADSLLSRREVYSAKVCPAAAGAVNAAVDVQDDRIEVLTVAWGMAEERWLLEHIVINQDPSVGRAWIELEEVLLRKYPHPGGKVLTIENVAIDSGGHHTKKVYAFSSRAQKVGRRWYAIRGVSGPNRKPWELSKEKLKDGVKLHLVGVDDMKSTLYRHYAIEKPGPGYVHVHQGFDEKAIEQMTIEHAETEYDKNGFEKRVWIKPRGKQNEMLDLMVYTYAAQTTFSFDMARRLEILSTEFKTESLDPEKVGQMFRSTNEQSSGVHANA